LRPRIRTLAIMGLFVVSAVALIRAADMSTLVVWLVLVIGVVEAALTSSPRS
jgi:hypothetical protein